MSTEGIDAREMDKGPGSSSLHGYPQEEAYSGQNQPKPAVSLSQGESQPLAASGPPSGIPQLFSSNSQNAIHPEQLHQFHNRGLGPNLGGPFPYGHPAVRGSTPSNDYHIPVSNLPPEHRLSSTVQLAPPFPYAHNSLGAGIGVMPPPPPPPPPYPMTAYPTWQQDPTAASGFLVPQEIQFQGVVGRPGGESSNQVPYQNFQQQGFPGMHPSSHQMMGTNLPENSIPSAELQLGTWIDPTLPPRALRNSYYDPKYEEMGLPVDPHLRNFLAKHGRGNS